MSMGCGAGGSCCETCRGGGLAGAPEISGYPNIVRVLGDYVDGLIASGRPFYISPELNSDALVGDGNMGFLAAILPAITALATKIGPAVETAAQVAGLSSAFKGSGGSKSSGPTSADIASAVTPAVVAQLQKQGIQLPANVTAQVTQAGLMDIFGSNTKPLLIAAAVGLVALLLLRRK